MTLAPADMICFALYSATQAMHQAYRPLLEASDLTYPQFLVLSALWQADDQTVGQLGRMVLLDSNTLTPLLKRLEGRGLVLRQRDPADERQVRVTLTEAGHALRSDLSDVSPCFFAKTGLTPGEARDLRDAVLSLRDRLREG